ncbi:hypothetical protein ACCS64_38730, partial [Rhizobium ruizarguesonis]
FSQLLTSWGMQVWIKDWLGNRDISLYSVFVAYLCQTVGFSIVLFLAGLQQSHHRRKDQAHHGPDQGVAEGNPENRISRENRRVVC